MVGCNGEAFPWRSNWCNPTPSKGFVVLLFRKEITEKKKYVHLQF
jgi:hypothetical protein